ncbi:MAG TPA: YggT family protein [Burkholderiales bacterium]|nr:YggT family protein [Burkholderiales bacterium]
MLAQIAVFLVDTAATFFVFVLLARFHFQWLRVPFHNPVGEFVLLCTNWIVRPARRFIPGLAGLDLPTLLLAWLVQALGTWLQFALVGGQPAVVPLLLVAAVDLLRYSLYMLGFAVVVQAVLSWVNPYTPVAPLLHAVTRPFLAPVRRFVPLVGSFDLSPLVLLVLIQVALIVVNGLRPAAAGLG